MTEDDPSGPEMPLSQFDEEAAIWFARMRGPDAAEHREAFEGWLALGALHRATYNRIAEIWVESEILKRRPEVAGNQDAHGATSVASRKPRLVLSLGLLACVGAVAALIPAERALFHPSSGVPVVQAATRFRVQTALGEIRRVALPDHSIVILDTNSVLTFLYDARERALRLERGRARFDVAHEPRPFVVDAGQGSVTAHGTIFDVDIAADHLVHVTLVRGSVDVKVGSGQATHALRAVRLAPGQALAFAVAGGSPSEPQQTAPSNWPSGNAEFDNVPLAAIVEQANRYAVFKIILADAAIGQLRVSGTFQIKDTRMLADRLAVLFGLTITPQPTSLLLSKK